MKIFERPSFLHRHSPAQVILVHVQVVLLFLTPCTQAGDILRMNAGSGSTADPTSGGAAPATAASINTAAATAQARANANDMLARNTMALQAVQAMQDAARAAATGVNNLGANPNGPGTLPNVPNANDPSADIQGMIAGGLEITGPPVGANVLSKSQENARAIVNIQQTQQQALLKWKTFNVGSETTVRFDQSAGGADAASWIAFNQVSDPSGNPTQILGSIESQGQVYVINQNGIIFGGTSVVNTGSLVASSLPINDNLVTRGLLNNPDSQFLFSANAQPAGSKGPTPAYTPPSPPASGRIGDVTVQAGARITAPTTAANVGGRVALIGPNVTNEGTISTPDGQTVLAAGMEVGFDAHSTDDPSLRGLDVFVGSVGSYGGTATNMGLIDAPRGSVVMTGKTVNQNGFISSTTSAALNGRVDLLARFNAVPNINFDPTVPDFGRPFVFQSGVSTGLVSQGAGAVIQILPEYSSALKVVGTELALKSQVNMLGLGVYLGTGSVVHAPNGDVALSAGIYDLVLTSGLTDETFVAAGGQIYLDQGAAINVAGSTGIASSIEEYILTVTLRASELADSPLQRAGLLRGETITVDLREHGTRADGTTWVGTPLANLTGYLGIIERNVGQLTTAGGHVTMTSGEAVIVREGAVVDVSGGFLDYAAGEIQTSRLIHEGNLVDIADARADILYEGIFTPATAASDPRWGTSSSSAALFAAATRYEEAYSSGGAGGGLQISSGSMALDGEFLGRTITGPQQLNAAPAHSSFELDFRSQQVVRFPLEYPYVSLTPPEIEIRTGASGLPAADAFALTGAGVPVALRAERKGAAVLSPELTGSQGFGFLTVDNSDGGIRLSPGMTLATPAGGAVTLKGSNIDIQGSILSPGGQIRLTAYDVSPFTTAIIAATGPGAVIPGVDLSRGVVTTGAAAVISTAGLIIDDRPGSATAAQVAREVRTAAGTYLSTTTGGEIVIDGHVVNILGGSRLDVGGGFRITDLGTVDFGDAGRLQIKAGRDPLLSSLLGGSLQLDGVLAGFSGARGGSLSLLAPLIQIGGVSSVANTLLLTPEFFSRGGFADFKLTGLGVDLGGQNFAPGVLLSPGVRVEPLVQSLSVVVNPEGGAIQVETLLKAEGYRTPVSLDFEAPGVNDFVSNQLVLRGGVSIGAGSLVTLDALGSVILHAQTVEVLGTIIAPGGSISITGADEFPQNAVPVNGLATVYLGSSARLSTAGKVVLLEDAFGRRVGSVHSGGAVSVMGNIVTAAGSVIDVSGTTGVLDLLPQEAGSAAGSVFGAGLSDAAIFPGTGVTAPPVPAVGASVATRIDSDAGSISLYGSEFLFNAATLVGNAGGGTAKGGELKVSSGIFLAPDAFDDDKDINLMVAQDITAFVQPVFAPGPVVGQALGGGLASMGYFGANSFQNGGFDALTLAGNVRFSGAVSLSARASLRVADGGVLGADALTQLAAPYVALGKVLANPTRDEELINPFILTSSLGQQPSYFSPTFGSGRLEVTADHIDVGFLSLSNVGQATLTGRQDIRGHGYFDMAGHLTLVAGQIYPTTASTFTITAYDYIDATVAMTGSVTVAPSGQTPEFPLSGGGRLNIFASTITQGGTLRAPLGSIVLGWDGSGPAPLGLVTNVSAPATQQVTLSAGSLTAVSAIDPVSGDSVTIPYGIVKDGTNWIDPTGFDITSTGAPVKTLRVSGQTVTTDAGAVIDIRGGGELYAYRWVQGNGGTNDILAGSTNFAILPGFDSIYSPFGAFATSGLFADNLGGDAGYVHDGLSVGDRIFLNTNDLVSGGFYTLLPARYALLPGAFLVTPDSVTPVGTVVKPGGAVLTNGYRYNALNPAVTTPVFQQFEIAPQRVVKLRSEFTDFYGSTFLPEAQQRLSLPVSRVPLDAGQAVLSAVTSMQLAGTVVAGGFAGGRGGLVDISSPLEILLAAPGAPQQPGKLVLNTTLLSGWNAESLLIGGERTVSGGRTEVNVRTGTLTVDNAGAPLSGQDIILAATGVLTLAPGAEVRQSGVPSAVDAVSVTGNGALVRVSGLASPGFERNGVTPSVLPSLNVGSGVSLVGAGLVLDSTHATSLAADASLTADSVSLGSGQISVQLTNPGALQPTTGLVLGGTVLDDLQDTAALSLLSYSSLDFYGTGTLSNTGTLALRAGEIRGFNQAGGTVRIAASAVLMDNGSNGTVVGVAGPVSGVFEVSADTITIGRNTLQVSQYATVDLLATDSIIMQETGTFHALANLNASTPYFTATTGARQNLVADGVLHLSRPGAATSGPASPGLGAHLTLQGSSITAGSDVYLPSGILTLHATTGNLLIEGRLDAGGTSRSFFDQIRYTDGGQVRLAADAGAITLAATGTINVAASPQAGDAGMIYVDAALGSATFDGSLLGQAGTGGAGAGIEMDVGTIASFAALNTKLNGGGFTTSQSMRVRNGSLTIDGVVNAHRFLLSLDQGSITVNGTINAAGQTGGRIDLIARGDVMLASGSTLTVAGQDFDHAGKGGSVTLESGTSTAGVAGTGRVNIATGSTIDLSVASKVAGDVLTPGSSAHQGKFSGKLHIRAPQNIAFNDLLVDPINGTIIDASSILVEGYRIYDLTASGGDISLAVQNSIHSNSQAFLGAAGATVTNFTNMTTRLLAGNAGLAPVMVLAPGAEIINRTGNLNLGTATSAASADWNLATFRYGPSSAPGVLTLRAAGNLEFYNTLNDGFNPATSGNAVERMWMGTLTALNTTLPVNAQSWSYRFTAGADLGAADFRAVVPLTSLGGETGSLLLGKDAGLAVPSSAGSNTAPGIDALTRLAINPTNGTNASTTSNRFQVIRTGSGDIEISAARDVQLLNQFATIYSAGTSVANRTLVFTAGDFELPNITPSATRFPNQGALGAVQQLYAASYSMAGGNVTVAAGRDIAHYTRDAGVLVADSQKQLPNNWLMRRGYVDENGEYGRIRVSAGGTRTITDNSASTSWWIDFSNFFDGVAALGGGNVELRAGRDVQNVSAHAPTNARAARGTPTAGGLLEMGGGDVNIVAGRNVDGGIYYVERGDATVFAAGDVTTNATRSPSLGRFTPTPVVYDERTWLPTTFFLGRGSVDITAGGDALVGPVANTMLLPQGLNNKHWYKTYFSTFSEDSAVSVTSLGGDITFREVGLTTNGVAPESILKLWMKEVLLLSSNSVSSYQPWLRLVETNVEPFTTLSTLRPGTLRANAFAGDVNVVGRMNLSPSPTGTLELLASGAVNGLQPAGVSSSIIPGRNTVVWVSSSINVSDASPRSVPGSLSPFAYYQVYYDPANPNANNSNTARDTGATFLNGLDLIFAESGSTSGIYASLQVKQSLHAAGGLHANDSEPIRISAGGGDISGLTLFTPKAATILAARDISDIAFFIQNLNAADVSIVSSGRDIIAFNANSVLRSSASVTGNQPGFGETTKSGDIQINGPGTLQLLAGRDINLGTGSNNSDGTGVGLVSLGNGRNPNLPFEGADIILGAGMGGAAIGLGGTSADFTTFISQFATSPGGDRYLQELAAILGVPAVDVSDPALTAEQQKQLALAVFFLALRDAGRDHNDPDSPDAGTYAQGFAAINALFPSTSPGSIQTQARDIRTRSGGDISILAPDGGLQLAPTLFGETLAPPGIITEAGGNISIFTNDDVNIGISRIFTLRGGDIVIWSSEGDIAAGSSAKTVQSAPPTRVLIDPQSAAVSTDLAGLATGGGIGVLATVAGVAPGNVDLIAPIGAVDAGDAGIRATGNLNIAATIVLNASNIAVGGTSGGTPAAPAVASPSIGGLAGAAAAGAAATSAAASNPDQQSGGQQQTGAQDLPSIISVEVIGYGGGSGDDDERRRNQPGE